jgi:hypothetical protein
MLLTVCVPEECVTVIAAAGLITTLSLIPGNAPVLQFVAVFQSPLPPTQDTVAAVNVLEKNRTAEKMAIPNFRSFLFINVELTKNFLFFMEIIPQLLPVQKPKRRDLLTPLNRHWYAFNGTLSGTPDVGVPRTVSVA